VATPPAPATTVLSPGWLTQLRTLGTGRGRPLLIALHPARWGLMVVALILIGLWMVEISGRPSPEGITTIRNAVVVRAPTREVPVTGAARLITLPDVWDHSPKAMAPLWYQLRFDLPANANPATLQGLYFERLCAAYEVRINGFRLAARGSVSAPQPYNCLDPVLITLPPALLKRSDNQLDIQVMAQVRSQVAVGEHAGYLSAVRIGRMDVLEEESRRARTFNVSATQALALLAGLVGAAALALATLTRLAYLGYFGAACVGWALLCALLTGARLPMSVVAHEWLIGALMPPVAVASVLSLMRYSGIKVRWLELSIALQSVVVPLSLVIAAPDRISLITHPWMVILSLEVAVATAAFLHRAWNYSPADFWVVCAALGAGLLVVLVEAVFVPVTLLLPGNHALSIAAVVMFSGMVLRLYQQLRGEVLGAEQGRLQAERRVQEISADIEKNYSHMAELRVEQVTAKERKRIAADLHDDLGAKLLTIVHTSDNERIATLGREALEEMRLSVRGLGGRAMQLGDAIGDWRSEVMMRMSQGGVELNWNTPDDLLMSERAMSARAYVQTTRILREAVSNILKHSGATHAEISIRQDINDFELTISDNGKGIPMELDGKLDRGHGMSTMKGRAKQLQGQCLVESGPGYGTTIRLTLPL
jgi:two-component system, NarL family, sensor histidine kinase UhpB